MANYISVSDEELRKFSDSVKNFQVKIDAALRLLEMDTNDLRANVDERTIVPMDIAVKNIRQILEDAIPSLKTLSSQAELYADAIYQIKAKIAARS